MKVLPKPNIFEKLQKETGMKDKEFADYLGVSRSQLWRAKLPPNDKRFSLGQPFIAKVLNRFSEYAFEELFFLDRVSQGCDKTTTA
ncbi:helix-turn-helix domain-containing protein [Paenibacillus elgii]|uniref:hypothetical protein n=1 Tax=Paenibacillus elgii TaxID=189691 RepID=UPI0013D0EFBC|nr:hypothetical protein [Paenibacillus elgii]